MQLLDLQLPAIEQLSVELTIRQTLRQQPAAVEFEGPVGESACGLFDFQNYQPCWSNLLSHEMADRSLGNPVDQPVSPQVELISACEKFLGLPGTDASPLDQSHRELLSRAVQV